MGLEGKHAIVTGASRGIGAAIARSLLEAGASVSLMGRNLEALKAQGERLAGVGTLHAEAIDVSDEASVKTAFARAQQALGPVTVLINNAGQAESQSFLKTDQALWNRMLAVNLTGTFLCTQAVLPSLLQAGWGRIVNIASTAGLTGYAYVSAYTTAKHGVIGLTRSLALELAQKNITVNAVCPGYTETDMAHSSIANIVAKTGSSEAEARAELVKHNPQGRLVLPEEVASTVLWLCQKSACAITGQAIAVAGGEVMP